VTGTEEREALPLVTGRLRRLRPGWYVLIGLVVYALVVTVMLSSARRVAAEERERATTLSAQLEKRSRELTWPIVGAGLPQTSENLPGARRTYRKGVSQGFVFAGMDAGVPISYGTAVVAAGDGEVTRADAAYRELTESAYRALLSRVAGGAAEPDLDRLRGRQVWIVHPDGTTTRYGHLARLAKGIKPGVSVRQGQVIAYVGNSGTLDASRGTLTNTRLLFEVWRDNRFLGEGLAAAAVREAASERIKPWP
jgi:murein DD-endopeptidase MepM/ murein hydrolase activator NlpD